MEQTELLSENLNIRRNHLSIRLERHFLAAATANQLLNQLINASPWQQPRIRVYGKWHPTPRLVAYYGDHDSNYTYSQTLHGALPWTPTLYKLKSAISEQLGAPLNAVLLNYYRDGHDTMGWHADDEKQLGECPTIASLSIGAARDIHFKPRSGKGGIIKLVLTPGSLLTMDGNTQQYWLHHIPKRATCITPRINLTFRYILPQ